MQTKTDDQEIKARILDGSPPPFGTVQDVFERAKRAPFFARKFKNLTIECWDDYFRLPLTTKEELRACEPLETLAAPRQDVYHYHESFGTTGRPLATWFTRDDYIREADLTRRWTEGIRPGMLILNRFPYSFAVPPFIIETCAMRNGGIVIPADNLNWNVSYIRTLELIRRLRVEVIACLPLEMIILEALAKKRGYDWQKDLGSLKLILLSGRVLPLALKEHFESRWNAKVSCVYGMTEGGGIASMCPAGRFHIHPDAFILELLDPVTGQHVARGEIGVLVLSNYYRQGAPLVRYNTRDCCRLLAEPCLCGDASPTIEVLGRLDDTIELVGKKIYFARLEQAVLEFASQFGTVVYFAIVTHKKLHIRVESENGLQQPSAETLQKLRADLGVPLKVHVCRTGELLDRGWLMRSPSVGKPHHVSDWRGDGRRCATLSESLIEWPPIGARDLADILRRALSNEFWRKKL